MNNPMSTAGTVPARKADAGGYGPSTINVSRCESGAMHTIRKIEAGQPFPCIRHPEQGAAQPNDCTTYARRLCGECSTGSMLRRRAGVAERPFTIPKEDPVAKKIICPECGRKMEEKARGVCARCYKYVAAGLNVPPLPPELQPKKAAPKAKPKQEATPKAPEQIGQLDDYPDTAPANHVADGLTDQILAEMEDVVDRGEQSRLVLDFSGFPGADELAEWIQATAEEQFRAPEAQAFYLLRQVQRVDRTMTRNRERFNRECRCSA
jgi:hypothetical protein